MGFTKQDLVNSVQRLYYGIEEGGVVVIQVHIQDVCLYKKIYLDCVSSFGHFNSD